MGAEGESRVEGHSKDLRVLFKGKIGVVEWNGGMGVQLSSLSAEECEC